MALAVGTCSRSSGASISHRQGRCRWNASPLRRASTDVGPGTPPLGTRLTARLLSPHRRRGGRGCAGTPGSRRLSCRLPRLHPRPTRASAPAPTDSFRRLILVKSSGLAMCNLPSSDWRSRSFDEAHRLLVRAGRIWAAIVGPVLRDWKRPSAATGSTYSAVLRVPHGLLPVDSPVVCPVT